MFERFTERARRVVILAQEEARRLNHNHIGTEHILLGLIHEGDGVAAASLESLGISLEAVRQQVEGIIGQGRAAPTGRIPYTPRAKKVLELSLREALQLGHNHIGTEHILLGLIREGRGAAAQVLVRLGADLARVREQVIQMLGDVPGEEEPGMRRAGKGSAARKQRGLLSEVLSRIESIDSRLAAVEQRVGAGPDVGDLDQEIGQARSGKKSAADAEDYEMATALRDRERQLLAEKASRQEQWAAAHLDLPSLAAGLHRLSEEVKRLRGLLREKGIEPQDGAA
ncbi:MAG: ATP-dependent Clp protease ATP-binding subunit ClpC [Streptosporangiaceae bacterium]|nr:ATP-dependent Clp protease ATP-binding subunit ClpC [Streptosporangiaceae bacterium]